MVQKIKAKKEAKKGLSCVADQSFPTSIENKNSMPQN